MRLATYNVNSISTRLTRVLAMLAAHRPDIACLQETKCTPEAFPHDEFAEAGYVAADHSGGRWAGVAVLARTEVGVRDVVTGLDGEPAPNEARWVEATVGDLRVASVYVPNGRAVGSETFRDKLAFLEAMQQRGADLADVPAVIAGDMNVCPTDLDVWDPDKVHGSTHVTDDERSRLQAVLDAGYVDTFRHLHPEEPGFTWWDYRAGAFHKGMGLRIDLVLASDPLRDRLTAAGIDRDFRKPTRVPGTKPSDHTVLLVDFA